MNETLAASRLGLMGVVGGLALVVAACSGSPSAPRSPVVDGVEVDSLSGSMSITIPSAWSDESAYFADYLGGDVTTEYVFFINGGGAANTSSFVLVAYPDVETTTGVMAAQFFSSVDQNYPDYEVAVRESFTTADGVRFERQDITAVANGTSVYVAQLVAVVDDTGIEIAVTLSVADDESLEAALDSIATLTFD